MECVWNWLLIYQRGLFLFLLLCPSWAIAHPHTQVLQSERFGELHVVSNTLSPQAAVILFSGDDGWTHNLQAVGNYLAAQGYFVIGVETPAYRRLMQEDDEDCLYLAGEVERLSQSVQSGAKLQRYAKPFLLGYSSGATLVYAILAQSADAFRGGISLGFCEFFDSHIDFCSGDFLRSKLLQGNHSKKVRLEPNREFSAPFFAIHGTEDTVCPFALARQFFADKSSVPFLALARTGHNVLADPAGYPALKDYLAELQRQDEQMASEVTENSVSDLPLVELKGEGGLRGPLVIFFSGDGGWATIDKEVGQRLAAKGIPVVGWNALQYFWQERDPDSTANDLARTISFYRTKFHASRVILAGYSMGAEIVPFVVNRLPNKLKAHVEALVLLAPETMADFEIHISAWAGFSENAGGRPVLPEIDKLKGLPILCIYGEDEAAESACPKLLDSRWKSIKLKGGHHFDGDYETVSAQIATFFSELDSLAPGQAIAP